MPDSLVSEQEGKDQRMMSQAKMTGVGWRRVSSRQDTCGGAQTVRAVGTRGSTLRVDRAGFVLYCVHLMHVRPF